MFLSQSRNSASLLLLCERVSLTTPSRENVIRSVVNICDEHWNLSKKKKIIRVKFGISPVRSAFTWPRRARPLVATVAWSRNLYFFPGSLILVVNRTGYDEWIDACLSEYLMRQRACPSLSLVFIMLLSSFFLARNRSNSAEISKMTRRILLKFTREHVCSDVRGCFDWEQQQCSIYTMCSSVFLQARESRAVEKYFHS